MAELNTHVNVKEKVRYNYILVCRNSKLDNVKTSKNSS